MLSQAARARKRTKLKRRAYCSALYRLQGGACFLCLQPMSRHRATRDHVTPRCRQAGFYGRILLAHPGCNAAKADRLPHPCELIYLEAVNLRLETEQSAATKAAA